MADHGAKNKTHIISFSGGLGSAVSAIIAWKLKLDFELVFADTLIEDEDLYRFIKEVAFCVGKEIHWLKDGRTPWEVFADDRKMGNTRNANCSTILKTNQVRRWADENFDVSCPMVLGMGLFELERIERAQAKWAPRPVKSLLVEHKVPVGKLREFIEVRGLRVPRLYDMGFPHNNCGGMCVRAGQKQFATLLEKMPERYSWHETQEQIAHNKIPGKKYPFIRDRRNGGIRYLTMKDFREEKELGLISANPYDDTAACSCFVE